MGAFAFNTACIGGGVPAPPSWGAAMAAGENAITSSVFVLRSTMAGPS